MKYLLKQNKEDKGILCDKVTIDGFDYYVSEEKNFKEQEICVYGNSLFLIQNILHNTNAFRHLNPKIEVNGNFIKDMSFCKFDSFQPLFKVIATNNPNIDIPKVVDDVEKLAIEYEKNKFDGDLGMYPINIYKDGYNKSQETHPNSNEDMKDFGYFCVKHYKEKVLPKKSFDELLKLWKEQQPKIVYYNE